MYVVSINAPEGVRLANRAVGFGGLVNELEILDLVAAIRAAVFIQFARTHETDADIG